MTTIYKTLTPRQYVREYGVQVPVGIQTVKIPVYNVRLAKGGRSHKQEGDSDLTVCGQPLTGAVAAETVTCRKCLDGLSQWLNTTQEV